MENQARLMEKPKEIFAPETKSVFQCHQEFLEKKAKFIEERRKWRKNRK